MAIKLKNLRSAASRSGRVFVAKSLNEAVAKKQQTAFLCHSHQDHELAKGLQVLLKENGWDLYIDWEDSEMPSIPNKETANIIKLKIKTTDWFLFLATKKFNSITLVSLGNWFCRHSQRLRKDIDYSDRK